MLQLAYTTYSRGYFIKEKKVLIKRFILALVFGGFSGVASAQEFQTVSVPSDPNAGYKIAKLDGFQRSALVVISQRKGPSGTSYSIREINCLNQTFRYMAEGDTLQEAVANIRDTDRMAPLVAGSISYHIVQAACR